MYFKNNLKDKWLFLLALFAATMVAFSIVGGFRKYSPLPFWDMWDGTVFFYHRIQSGDYAAWWDLHNEHRIVLARILFWIDYKLFSGLGIFLVIFNYILAAFSAFLFWIFIRESSPDKTPAQREKILGLFLTAWVFLWAQENNLTWAFQSQFFLAQSIPLLALFLQTKSITTGNDRYFIAACIFGALSITTMANGVLALPLMLVYSVLMHQGKVKHLVLLSLSAVCLAAYFFGYQAPTHHGKITTAFFEHPIALMHYTVVYLGNPFYYVLDEGETGKVVAAFAGILLLVLSAWFFIRELLKRQQRSPKILALLIYIVYLAGTALGTGGGRSVFGFEQALSSRYATPSVMAFAALAIIMAETYKTGIIRFFSNKITIALSVAFGCLLLNAQAKAFNSVEWIEVQRNVTILSLVLGIRDESVVKHLFHSSDMALAITKISQENNYSIFGRPPFRGLQQQLETTASIPSKDICAGGVYRVEALPNNQPYLKIYGWTQRIRKNKTAKFFRLIDENQSIVGFAIPGQHREDNFNNPTEKQMNSGFTGYILPKALGHKISAIGETARHCSFDIGHVSTLLPPLRVDFKNITHEDFGESTIETSDIINNQNWNGSDFQKTAANKIQVLGSFVSSDADTGSMTLQVKNKSRLFFKSGPTTGRQYIEVLDTGEKILLPGNTEWSLFEVSRPHDDKPFQIRIVDAGSSWGEWSAIAIGKN